VISAVLYYIDINAVACHCIAFNELGWQFIYFPMMGMYVT